MIEQNVDVFLIPMDNFIMQVWAEDIQIKANLIKRLNFIVDIMPTNHKDCIIIKINPLYAGKNTEFLMFILMMK